MYNESVTDQNFCRLHGRNYFMKNNIKKLFGVLLLLAALSTGSFADLAGAGLPYQPEQNKVENSYAEVAKPAAAALGERRNMVVCSSILNIYSDESLAGDIVAVRNKGEIIEASTDDGLIYQVYSNSGIAGYCRASGLIYADTKTVVKLPVLWEIDPDSAAKKYTELTDVNEFAYNSQNGLRVNSEVVLVQRDLLISLSKAASSISSGGYTLAIEQGYSTDEAPEGCPADFRSGALVRLSLTDSGGNVTPLSENARALSAVLGAGLVRFEESELFYLSSYDTYMLINISSSDYVYVIYG